MPFAKKGGNLLKKGGAFVATDVVGSADATLTVNRSSIDTTSIFEIGMVDARYTLIGSEAGAPSGAIGGQGSDATALAAARALLTAIPCEYRVVYTDDFGSVCPYTHTLYLAGVNHAGDSNTLGLNHPNYNANWRDIDKKAVQASEDGMEFVIALYAPKWMCVDSDNSATINAVATERAPTDARQQYFTILADACMVRYNGVRLISLNIDTDGDYNGLDDTANYPMPELYAMVLYSEEKGLFRSVSGTVNGIENPHDAFPSVTVTNNYHYPKLASMINDIAAVRDVTNPDCEIWGPYFVVQDADDPMALTSREDTRLDFFLANCPGLDAIAWDRNAQGNEAGVFTAQERAALLPNFGLIAQRIAALTAKPQWVIEAYPGSPDTAANGDQPDLTNEYQGAGHFSILLHLVKNGVRGETRWEPEAQQLGTTDTYIAHDGNIFTSTQQTGGADPYPAYYGYKVIGTYYGAGKPLVDTTSDDAMIEIIATAASGADVTTAYASVVNKYDSSKNISLDGQLFPLAAYELAHFKWNGTLWVKQDLLTV